MRPVTGDAASWEQMEARGERFRRLLEPHHDRVVGFARSLCRGTAEGDDLFQDAMLHAFTKLESLRDDGAFRAWLYRIVLNVHRSRCRRAFWRRLIQIGEREVDDDGVAEHDYRTEGFAPDVIEANRRARTALSRLPVRVREAIVLFEIEGWQVDEIAALQRVSVSAIKSRLARGRARLRALYDGEPVLASTLVPGDNA